MSVSWSRDERTNHDTPVVDRAIWRGVAIGLPMSLALWAVLLQALRWIVS